MNKTKVEDVTKMRHSMAHIMAAAIQKIWPSAKFGVGPSVDNGFYYDIDLGDVTVSEDDFKKIEKEMGAIIKAQLPFEKTTLGIDDAIKWAEDSNQPYKKELLKDLKTKGTTSIKDLGDDVVDAKTDIVTFYKTGSFVDLCKGPHIENTSQAGYFKIMRVAGAYWRGNEKNPQMQRIYAVAFNSQKDLDDYLVMLEEAKKRDHRKLGQELDLFTFSDLVGAGLPLYTPRGTAIIEELKKVLQEMSREYRMQQVSIPHLAKIDLYRTSGHADKFADELFHVKSHYDQEFVLKPVNCPHHTQIYASKQRSYRDLPLRYVEQTMQYRDEKPGQIGGLQRTRGFTVDDGHTFCRVDQIEEEVSLIVDIIQNFYKKLGLWGEHWVSLSVRDISVPERYIGEPENWDKAEAMLEKVANKFKLGAKKMVGEAAIYGPKIDFMFKDALGRETQLATVQLDFAMPKRFGLSYVDQNGQSVTPVMIHRAILGSFERFIMLLIEHFAGKFPVWLAPEQLRILTVNQTEEIVGFAQKYADKANGVGIRVTLDDSNESVGKKIRNAEFYKIPYTVVVGDKELESNNTVPRIRSDLIAGESKIISLDDLIAKILDDINTRRTGVNL